MSPDRGRTMPISIVSPGPAGYHPESHRRQLHCLVLRQRLENFRGRGSSAVLSGDLIKKHDSLTIDQERRWIGRFRWRVPPEAILIRELVTRVEQQLEVSRQFLVGQELLRTVSQILRRTRVDQ